MAATTDPTPQNTCAGGPKRVKARPPPQKKKELRGKAPWKGKRKDWEMLHSKIREKMREHPTPCFQKRISVYYVGKQGKTVANSRVH